MLKAEAASKEAAVADNRRMKAFMVMKVVVFILDFSLVCCCVLCEAVRALAGVGG